MPDTIYALASGRGKAGVAVLRISGPRSDDALEALADRAAMSFPARRACRVRLLHPESREPLDDALVIRFPAPHSYTGETVVELHLHGGVAVVAGVLEALRSRPGLRTAEPGEFTRRAFLSGKLDLTAVEGLADLIDAETEAQRRQALRQAGGALSRLYDGWAGRLTRILAHREAAIDFVEEDLPEDMEVRLRAEVDALRAEMETHLADGHRGERLRGGLRLAIMGRPNVGKSTLLNRLVARDAAIVSPVPGTTRDVLEYHLDIGGYPVLVADTAGLRDSEDPVEQEGIRRAKAWAKDADLRILVVDGFLEGPESMVDPGADTLVLANKQDIWPAARKAAWAAHRAAGPVLAVSLESLAGWDKAYLALVDAVARRCSVGESPLLTRARHRDALSACVCALMRSQDAVSTEISVEALRESVRALGRITGRVDVEALLDVIFRDFCIGK